MQGPDLKQLAANLAKKKLIAWLIATVGPYIAGILLILVLAGSTVAMVAAIGQAADKLWGGITSVLSLPGDLVDSLKDTDVDETIRNELDCRNLPPDEAKPGKNCIEGLLDMGENQQSPIPSHKEWLVPVWQAAADKYKIEWELLAAVNGARTNFGDDNCTSKFGDGFYRTSKGAWEKHATDGGKAKTENAAKGCRSSDEPAKLDKDNKKSTYDAVDASFTQAKLLADEGASDSAWEYTGSPPASCVPNRKSEGPIYFMPDYTGGMSGTGAVMGGNRKLKIDRELVTLAAKYRSDTGKWKPARTRPGMPAMPQADVRRLLRGAWQAFGASGGKLDSYVAKNMKQVERESGFRPQVLQGYIGDVNDNNPAGGLVQFIPGTFDTWKVDGFNDRFNPLDNLLAAVNAQVNSESISGAGPGGILDGRSGWSPHGGSNPYKTGGTSTVGSGAFDGTLGAGSLSNSPTSGSIVKIPKGKGVPGDEEAAASVVPNIMEAIRRYDLILTDAYDRDRSAGHSSPGHNVTGTAADFSGSDRNMDRAVKELVAQGYEVGYDGRYGSQDWDGHGPRNGQGGDNAHLHVEFGSGGQMSFSGRDTSTPVKYDGANQTDATSRAVKSNGPDARENSECYVAIVNEWYQGIKNNPPGEGGAGYTVDADSVRGKIIQVIQGELKDGVVETGVNDGEPVKRYKFPAGQPWCAYFASWVWQQAGLKDFTQKGHVDQFRAWGKQRNLWKGPTLGRPVPGDTVIYGSQHIGVVEKVKGRSFTSIEGNYGNKVARRGPQTTSIGGQGYNPAITDFVSPVRGSGGAVSGGSDELEKGEGNDGSTQ